MKMTSRIYGIAVKETVDYYEYDDIKLVFNQDTKQWSVFSNYDNLWMNGVQYHKGDLVVMFADGKVDTYTMMAQYTDTTPYINYMYTITSNFVINPSYYQNGRIEYIFEADPETEPYQFTCKKLLNNVQQNSYTLTDVDIKTYKNQNHGKLPTLFDNMKVDWHGMNPESPYLPYSFTIISNSNYIKDGTTPKQINDIIIQIPAGSGASSYFHRILDETNKHEATPKPGELPSVLMTKKIGKYNVKPSVTFNRETIIRKIYHDHTKVYYNGHYHRAMYLVYDSTGAQGCWKKTIEGLAFTYADPFWLCMTTSAGIELGGQVLEAKRLVRCWKDTDDINLTMRKTKSRKKAAPETAPYDDIIYDVVSNASNVTVTKYRRKTKIDAQGHKTTEDIQEDLPIVFDTGDSPVRCWNIEFRAKNNVWIIYSKCGYIRYGGRQYPKNRSILDFNAGEEMHIEIKDETEKYEVDEVITYTVTNVMVTKFIYKVWTVGESYTIKVEKSAENVDPEPWVTVNFYDAWNEHPVVIDDIQLDYDIKTNIWTLSSASDELYYYGNKINKGEKIAEWGFNTIISLKDERGINVISANAEKDVKVHIDSTKSQPQGLDISEFYPSNDYYNVDFLLTHSVTKGEWVITSKRDDTYMNGVRYTYNKVIFQGSDKQGYPEFTFMCQHKKDESGPIIPYRNIRYTITISWDPYEQIGNLAVQAEGGESKVYYTREKDPAKNTIVLTKQNAKSMYGYIWKRDMPGPGPTTVKGIVLEMQYYTGSTYYDGIYVFNLRNKTSRTIASYSRVSWPPYDPPFSKQLRSFYYQHDSSNYIAYIYYSDDGFNNDRHTVYVWGTFRRSSLFIETMNTFVTYGYTYIDNAYILNLYKYMIYQDSITLMETYTFTNSPESVYNDTINSVQGKLSNGCYVSGLKGRFIKCDISSFIITKYDYSFYGENYFKELYDYLESAYPTAKGSTGYDSGPHINGYYTGIDESSDGYFGETSPPPNTNLEDPDGNFIAYIKFTVGGYRTWYTEHTSRGDYWHYVDTPIRESYLVVIKFNRNGTISFDMTPNNILLDCFSFNKYTYTGKFLDNWKGSYKSGNDMYLIVPEFAGTYNTPECIYICKYNKETNFFEVIKTITQSMKITLDVYNVPSGYKTATRTYSFIGDIMQCTAGMNYTTFPSYIEYFDNDVPIDSKTAVLLRKGSWTHYDYFYFDNPLFNVSVGNMALER